MRLKEKRAQGTLLAECHAEFSQRNNGEILSGLGFTQFRCYGGRPFGQEHTLQNQCRMTSSGSPSPGSCICSKVLNPTVFAGDSTIKLNAQKRTQSPSKDMLHLTLKDFDI